MTLRRCSTKRWIGILDSAEAQNNLGNILRMLNRNEEAVPRYEKALALRPDDAETFNNLGNALLALKRYEGAIACYERTLALGPANPAAHNNLGVALKALGRHEAAAAQYGKALTLKPDYAEALGNLGSTLYTLDRHAEAAPHLVRALALQPKNVDIHSNLGNVLKALGRIDEAIACYERALGLKPDHAEAHNNLGTALKALGRLEEAMARYEAALALRPDYPEAHSNLGNVLHALNRNEEALARYERALELRPGYAEAHNNMGTALRGLNRLDEAIAHYQRALALKPGYVEAERNEGLAHLGLGNLAEGWKKWPWFDDRASPSRDVAEPMWLGDEDVSGKTVLLQAELGLGDTIQFARYAPLVARQGARVILRAQPPLVPLLAGLKGVAQVLPLGTPPPAFDRHCALTRLPQVFGTTMETVPAETPYLAPPVERLAPWRSALAQDSGDGRRLIGLVWAGNPGQGNDHNRSMPLAALSPILEMPGVRVVGLQKALRPGDADLLASPGVLHLGERLQDFADTAAVVSMLDLVITVDTSVAHLAGALGKLVWIMLTFAPDWRWLPERERNPWYPSARLFRQRSVGDWAGVVAQVCEALGEWSAPAG